MVNRYVIGLTEHVARLRNLAQQRRTITPMDTGADALDYAAGEVEGLIQRLTEPTVELTLEEWAAEQDPPVAASTARRWCRAGQVDFHEGPRGIRVMAGTRRRIPEVGAVAATPEPAEPMRAAS